MTAVKVCGVTRPGDAAMLVELGVDVIGLNFWPQSKRYITREQAIAIVQEILSCNAATIIVGLFVNHSMEGIVEHRAALGLDRVQLHGDESVAFAEQLGACCIKALPLATEDDLVRAQMFSRVTLLVDSHSPERGGSGLQANWQLAKELSENRSDLWLAGGLRADNVKAAIELVRPYGVDLASGVESSPGVKDRVRVQEFLAAMGKGK